MRVNQFLASLKIVVIVLLLWVISGGWAESIQIQNSPYQEQGFHSPDGIGKFYMGREIAQVMGVHASCVRSRFVSQGIAPSRRPKVK
jgi:Na+/proline symporter